MNTTDNNWYSPCLYFQKIQTFLLKSLLRVLSWAKSNSVSTLFAVISLASSLQAAEFHWHFMVSGCCFAASLSLFIYPFGHSGSEKKNILIKKTKQNKKSNAILFWEAMSQSVCKTHKHFPQFHIQSIKKGKNNFVHIFWFCLCNNSCFKLLNCTVTFSTCFR